MGCETSTSNVQQLSEQTTKKRHIKTGFKESQRNKLLQAIEWNDPCDFAVAAEQFNVPIIAQLSQEGLFWMAHHFCCRWNAFKVLDYVLKSAYVEDPKHYLRFINQQTIQGFSCLHLCAIWNASQCMQILLGFGGINLQTKDKKQATAYQTAINYKRTDMKRILKEYQELGIGFLIVQHQKLSTGDILALQTADSDQFLSKSKFVPQLNNGLKGALGNLFLQSEQQKLILQQKKKIQIQRQNLRIQLRRVQQQQARKIKQRQITEQTEKKAKVQRQIQQNEKKLIQSLKNKQSQLSKIKNDLNKINAEKQKLVLDQEKKKSYQFYKNNEVQLTKKINNTKAFIENQRQSVIKARNQRLPKPQSSIEMKQQIYGELPAQLKNLYDQAKRSGLFIDRQFPQHQNSIGNTPKAKKFAADLIWLRPKQIFTGDYQLFDGIDPNDIKQGSLGVCYMLATLSTLAQYPIRVKNIFAFHDKNLGFYVIKLLIHGQIKYIPIDDSIPCNKSTKSPLFAKPNGNELWVCLVEKAWAKCIGSYMKAQSMTPNHLMQDLTTCPSFGAWFKDKTQKTKDINTHIKMKNIVVLTSVSDKKIEGIVNNHAYSLLNVYQHQGKNIYKIRNPWGKFEWNGQFNQKSGIWTQQLKKKVDFVDADDGIFFLSESQLLQAFVYYSISITRLDHKYSYIALKTTKNESRYYQFELKQDQQINLRFVQKFNRMLNDESYKYSPVIFEVGKIENSGEVTFLTEGDNSCFWGAKSTHADPQILKGYSKGKYFVRIQVQWENQAKYNTGVFSIFAKQQLKITQLSLEQGKQIWIELLKNYAIKKGTVTSRNNMDYIMTWMRAQMICYSYAKQTQKAEKFQSKWTFEPSKFTNCAFNSDHTGGNDMKYLIGRGKNNANIGILRRLLINRGCNSGSVFISATPL